MLEPSVIHNTFVIERSFPKPPETVFAAFADSAKRRRWFAEADGNTVEEFTQDFRVGGSELLRYHLGDNTPFPGVELINAGSFQQIVPNQRIVSASTMDLGGRRISASLITFELLPTATGTNLICTNQSAYFEGSGGPEMREMGWRHLFVKLEKELAS